MDCRGRKRKGTRCMSDTAESWVVYQMTLHKRPEGMRAVCTREDWDAMERARPGYHTLLQAGFPSERDAELIARGTSGDVRASSYKPRRAGS